MEEKQVNKRNVGFLKLNFDSSIVECQNLLNNKHFEINLKNPIDEEFAFFFEDLLKSISEFQPIPNDEIYGLIYPEEWETKENKSFQEELIIEFVKSLNSELELISNDLIALKNGNSID